MRRMDSGKDIDNTLTLQENEDNEQVYQNTASNVQVQIAKTSDTDELVSIERDGIRDLLGLSTTGSPDKGK